MFDLSAYSLKGFLSILGFPALRGKVLEGGSIYLFNLFIISYFITNAYLKRFFNYNETFDRIFKYVSLAFLFQTFLFSFLKDSIYDANIRTYLSLLITAVCNVNFVLQTFHYLKVGGRIILSSLGIEVDHDQLIFDISTVLTYNTLIGVGSILFLIKSIIVGLFYLKIDTVTLDSYLNFFLTIPLIFLLFNLNEKMNENLPYFLRLLNYKSSKDNKENGINSSHKISLT